MRLNKTRSLLTLFVQRDPPASPAKQTLLIKTKPSATLYEREGVINGVRNYLKDDSIIVQNTQDVIDSTKIAVNLLDLFFYTGTSLFPSSSLPLSPSIPSPSPRLPSLSLRFLTKSIVAAISVVLCFFVLWLSFTANVNENSWEFGVLRSIGLTVCWRDGEGRERDWGEMGKGERWR